MKKYTKITVVSMGMVGALGGSAVAGEEASQSTFFKDVKPIFDVRFRYEGVEQEGFDEDATALTYRIRGGFEAGIAKDTKVLFDFEHVEAVIGEFNSTINQRTNFPVVADPEVTELNRLQIQNTSLSDTVITLGRQRIKQDDDRFVGNVGWRQNEQTFDALRVVNKSIENLTLDVTYVDQVNRIFGDDSPMGRWDSNSVLANVAYKVPVKGAKVTLGAYGYFLDFEEDAPTASSQTLGVSAKAQKGPIAACARYAHQSDYGDQPISYEASYWMLEGQYKKGPVGLTAGIETLGSDEGAASFQTPLATLHKFNGFSDLFLRTPDTGLQDIYGTASFAKKSVGPVDLVKAWVTYHDFSADEGDAEYGSEVDAGLVIAKGQKKFLVKYADYQADDFLGDRQKLWIEAGWSFK